MHEILTLSRENKSCVAPSAALVVSLSGGVLACAPCIDLVHRKMDSACKSEVWKEMRERIEEGK